MALNVITAHKGTPHITYSNVRELIGGIAGMGFVSSFNEMSISNDGLIVTVAPFAGIIDGFHFESTSNQIFNLNGTNDNQMRVDVVYLTVYNDNGVQKARFDYIEGNVFAASMWNMFTENPANFIPEKPSGANILATELLFYVALKNGAIAEIYNTTLVFPTNRAMKVKIDETDRKYESLLTNIHGIQLFEGKSAPDDVGILDLTDVKYLDVTIDDKSNQFAIETIRVPFADLPMSVDGKRFVKGTICNIDSDSKTMVIRRTLIVIDHIDVAYCKLKVYSDRYSHSWTDGRYVLSDSSYEYNPNVLRIIAYK